MSPTSFSEISIEFLQDCLSANGHEGDNLTNFKLSELPEPGQTASMAFVDLEYRQPRDDLPARLVAKQKTDYEEAQEYIEKLGATQREIAFYEEVGDACQMPIPKGYYGCYEDGDFLLLMEDKSGPLPGDWVTATIDQAKGLVGNLQAMHSHWWEDKSLKEAVWRAGFNSEPGCFMHAMQETFQECAEKFVTDLRDEIDDHMAETVIAAFKKPEVIRAFDGLKSTMVHGDYHYKNAFFPEDSAPIVFDWQCVGYGTPTIDLGRVFIFLSGGAETNEATDAILKEYHTHLEASGVEGYSLQELQSDMALGLLYNTWLTINALMETDIELIRSIIESHGSTLSVLMDDFSARIAHSGCKDLIESY